METTIEYARARRSEFVARREEICGEVRIAETQIAERVEVVVCEARVAPTASSLLA